MLDGKVAVITGGTRGIGFASVKTFLDNGAKVVLLGSKEESVNKAIEELKKINEDYEVGGAWPNLSDLASVEETFKEFGIEVDKRVLSAHRTPHELENWVSSLRQRGFSSVIAGAGWAAHLAGVVAAFTTLPVIGVPIKGPAFEGLDALLSMVQMPSGIPVAVVAVNGAKNAALLAIQILAVTDNSLKLKLDVFRKEQADNVLASVLS